MKKNKNKNKNTIDTSPVVPQKSKIKTEIKLNSQELTEKQKNLVSVATDKNTRVVFLSGPAGTAKTYTFVLAALQLLNQKKISDIMYIRSAIESADGKIGFLPGEIKDKIAPYMQPFRDKLEEIISKEDIECLEKENRIGTVPVSYLRGLSWNAKCIIVDEAQNLTKKELITLLTRVGKFSKIFLLGDVDQSDISKSGFEKLTELFEEEADRQNGIFSLKLTEDDILRDELTKYIVKKLKKL